MTRFACPSGLIRQKKHRHAASFVVYESLNCCPLSAPTGPVTVDKIVTAKTCGCFGAGDISGELTLSANAAAPGSVISFKVRTWITKAVSVCMCTQHKDSTKIWLKDKLSLCQTQPPSAFYFLLHVTFAGRPKQREFKRPSQFPSEPQAACDPYCARIPEGAAQSALCRSSHTGKSQVCRLQQQTVTGNCVCMHGIVLLNADLRASPLATNE